MERTEFPAGMVRQLERIWHELPPDDQSWLSMFLNLAIERASSTTARRLLEELGFGDADPSEG